jgi:HEAT repeat protein
MKKEHLYLLVLAVGAAFLGWWWFPRHDGTKTRPADVKSPELLRAELESADRQVRADAATALGVLRDVDSLPQLIGALEDDDPFVRARAAAAIEKIFGGDLYFRANDPPEKRREAIQRIREHWQAWQAAGFPGRPDPPTVP